MKIVVLFVLVIHGLIHLMGFVKAYGLAEINQLTQYISKTSGTLWLMTALLFLATAIFLAVKKEWWWLPASAGIVISQILISFSWQDAKFGTIANIIILVAIIVQQKNQNLLI